MTHLDVAVTLLRDLTGRIADAHERAWWPASTAVRWSQVGGSSNHIVSPQLTPGDRASLNRWVQFVGDVNVLRAELDRHVGLPRPPVALHERTNPSRVAYDIAVAANAIARVHTNGDVAAATVDLVVHRATVLSGHIEALLSTPRNTLVPCRFQGQRDLCNDWATNIKRRLCRSCENHLQYKRRDRRIR
jgi:hypothetical protein